MLKELVQFTEHLPEEVKKAGILPKEGLHILVNIANNTNELSIDFQNYQCEIYNKPKNKEKTDLSEFLFDCAMRSNYAWCIDTNKCFDLPTKAIHSCSPYCVAFKREHLQGGEKFKVNEREKKKQIFQRFNIYFDKALLLCAEPEEKERLKLFQYFFAQKGDSNFEILFGKIISDYEGLRDELNIKIVNLKVDLADEKDKNKKEQLKENIAELEAEKNKYRQLLDSDYIVFYLNEPLEKFLATHEKYLKDKLFNTAEYNTLPDKQGNIYGTSNFHNGFNNNMPFLLHQTASFDITFRISDQDANELYNFEKILARGFMPNPLPIFIYKDELEYEHEMVRILERTIQQGDRIGYQEIVKQLWNKHEADLQDYYLLFHQNTKEGIVFYDFDFVSKFEYLLKDSNNQPWEIFNLFDLKEKKEGSEKTQSKFYPKIRTVFDLERSVFAAVLSNKYRKFDFYFKDLDGKDFEQLGFTLIAVRKYRKAIYDYIYKSKRHVFNELNFTEIIFSCIKDDLKYNKTYGIKEKLNIWFSLYEKFILKTHDKQKSTMASELNNYQQFIDELASGEGNLTNVTDEYFAFAAGQVIYYILEKSKSGNNSYQLLEPYLQQSKCHEFKKAIANDFSRYKHENFSGRFEKVAAFVLAYETNENIKNFLPQILAGVFATNQLFSKAVKTDK